MEKTEKPDLRKLAVVANQRTWEFLQKRDRTQADDARMISCAYASLHLWDQVGTDLHRARGHWLITRVLVTLKSAELAARHAVLCAEITERCPDATDFDRAYASEGLARASACAGNLKHALAMRREAELLGSQIANDEDRKTFEDDLAAEPWFGLPIEASEA